jgi:hypothetical protein
VRTTMAVAGAALLLGLVATPAAAQEDALTFTAAGSGTEEVPAGAGEDGATVAGTFSLSSDDVLTYTVSAQGQEGAVAGAHIHEGAAGTNGPVAVALDEAAVNAGREATVDVPAEVADALRADVTGFYLNVHSAAFPDGFARGQLTTAGGTPPILVDTGSGGQAAGADPAGPALVAALAGAVVAGALLARRHPTG